MTTQEQQALLRTKDVVGMLGISRRTLERWCKIGAFPTPLRLGGRTLAWTASDVETWLEDLRWQRARDEHNSAVKDPDALF